MNVQRSRGALVYTKPPLSVEDLVARLTSRGLQVPDATRAQRYIRHIGYFRLSPYTIPFQVPGTDHVLRDGTAFDDILDLYVFDRALRLLVLDALERVEVAIRSALTDHMSVKYGDSHWYLDRAHFRDGRRYDKFIQIVRSTCDDKLQALPEDRGDHMVFRSALEHYLTTYGTPELPPSWLMVEALTAGQLRGLIENLKSRADRSAIAVSLGINEPLLVSWLGTYVRVRNICAHHGRLWNVGLGVYPAVPKSKKVPWINDTTPINNKRLYPVLISLQSVLDTVSPNSSWAQRLSDLLHAHPAVPLRGMGIPPTWREDEFWARHLT